jgi:ABC-2 type transport system permease protein
LRSPDTYDWQAAPLRPLLAKELRELISGRALWIMLLLLCPLIGYSFFQAVSLYTESSTAALQSPVLANSLSPLDGILVPTLGSFYVAVTLLFPFVAIRALGQEKETGALRLLVQLPYRLFTIVSAKFAAVLAAWIQTSSSATWSTACWSARSRCSRRRSRKARPQPRLSRLPSQSGHGSWISPSPAIRGSCHGLRNCR